MKNKGFTLIEILATIVILAIITLIAIPIVAGVITKVKLGALKSSAYGLIESSDLYYAIHKNLNDIRFDINDNIMTSEDTDTMLNYKGVVKSGMVVLTSGGKVALCITDGTHSVYKNYNDTEVKQLADKVCTIPRNSYVVYVDNESTLTKLDNSELSDLVDRLNRKISNIETNKADQSDFENTLDKISNARTLASNSASKEDVELISTIVTGVKTNATNLLSETDNMKTNIDQLKQVVDNAKAKVDASGTAAAISTASSDASAAKTDAETAKTDAATAKSTATTAQNAISGKTTISAVKSSVYPVGSIYISYSSTDPGSLFGGTWTRIYDRVLVGAGSSYGLGATGGNNYVSISHYHGSGDLRAAIGSCNSDAFTLGYSISVTSYLYSTGITYVLNPKKWTMNSSSYFNHFTSVYGNTDYAGTGSLDVRMPFRAVYMWRRTA